MPTDPHSEIADHERRELIDLLIRIHELLEGAVNAGPTTAIPPGLHTSLQRAFADLGNPRSASLEAPDPALYPDGSPPLEEAVRVLMNGGEHEIEDVYAGLRTEGFTSHQLAFKLAVFRVLDDDYRAIGAINEIPKNDEGWLRRAARKLKRVLAPAGVALGSLSNVPGLGVLRLPAEFVDFVASALDAAES